MSLEIADFMHHLDGFDMTHDQKAELIRTLELIMTCFIDEAFGVESTQLALGISTENLLHPAADAIGSPHSTQSQFNEAAR